MYIYVKAVASGQGDFFGNSLDLVSETFPARMRMHRSTLPKPQKLDWRIPKYESLL